MAYNRPKQIMVNPPAAGAVGGLGRSNLSIMQKAYPGSPVYKGELSDEIATAAYMREVTNATLDDGGHTFGVVSLNYQDAPDITAVVTGGGGLPGHPHAPNIASPPTGQNPADIPEAGVEATIAAKGAGGAFGNGENINPSVSSANIATQSIVDGSRPALGKSGA